MSFTKPNQPDPKFVRKQVMKDRTLSFQKTWYEKYPWLHVSPGIEGVLCFQCAKYYKSGIPAQAKSIDQAFVTSGYKNWRRALEKFSIHEKSAGHKMAVTTAAYERNPVSAQLSSAVSAQQAENRESLLKIIGGVMLLARQGVAFRGHEHRQGNLDQLLKYKAEGDAAFSRWLCGKRGVHTSWDCQNEILDLMSSSIIREIADEIRSLPVLQYAVIMDGTRDTSGVEQEALCLRYVDKNLMVHEEFIGLYETTSTTGENLAKIILDVLLRLNLPISGLRGQAYDGASNMSGKYAGAQAVIQRKQPLAPFIHCGAHCVNLVTHQACSASPLIRNALDWVHDLGTFFGQSGKLKDQFKAIAASEGEGSVKSIRPLCPTRWTVRSPAIRAVLGQYGTVLQSLDQMSASNSESASRAEGLHVRLQQGNVVLGLMLALDVISELEVLNASLQRSTQTVEGMVSAVSVVQESLKSKRTSDHFQKVFKEAEDMVEKLCLEPIALPRTHRPPKRYSGPAPAHRPASPVEFHRVEFYRVLDTVDAQITDRFMQPGIQALKELEALLLTPTESNVAEKYPELQWEDLKIQLAMFKNKYTFKTTADVAQILKAMPVEVRGLFEQVETIVRLLIVVPASSAEAERSFSGLRRLKTWLRSTMTQKRLNGMAVCHIHQERLDNLKRRDIAQTYIQGNDRRREVFGSFL
ncbi:hypothetical protein ACEWY4_003137 [Coilia grayii]|uniref:TTF-type domain-containing protein n=1 Tax=Coilia grayii TaxID=363190 RepID=A0ABD1KQV2_9TELE